MIKIKKSDRQLNTKNTTLKTLLFCIENRVHIMVREFPTVPSFSPFLWIGLTGAILGFRSLTSWNHFDHLGMEYFNIAKSLASGVGFANPFFRDTGPTAWMPPAYPVFLALLILILGSRAAVAWCVGVLHIAAMFFTGFTILKGAARMRSGITLHVASIAYSMWMIGYESWFFRFSHDVWWNMIVIDAIILVMLRFWWRPAKPKEAVWWGLVGGWAGLSNPVTGFAWSVATLTTSMAHRSWRLIAISFPIAGLLTGLWVVRNEAVFNRPYLVKSNLFYELYAANVMDPDGVYTRNSFQKHPLWESRKKGSFSYQDLGEVAFVEEYRQKFLSFLQREPGTYLAKVGNRLLSMTLVHRSYRQFPESRFPWLTSLIHPVPFISFLFLLLAGAQHRKTQGVRFLLIFYATFLIIYGSIAFYTRYLLPLTPVLILMVYAAGNRMNAWLKSVVFRIQGIDHESGKIRGDQVGRSEETI